MGALFSFRCFFLGDSNNWTLASTCLEYSFPDDSCNHQNQHLH
jgi:hypothetical protein